MRQRQGRDAGDEAELRQERLDPQLRWHQSDQAPGKRFLQRFAVKVVLFRGMQRHHPAGMVDGPATATAGGDRAAKGILQGAAFQRRIDAGMRQGAGIDPERRPCDQRR